MDNNWRDLATFTMPSMTRTTNPVPARFSAHTTSGSASHTVWTLDAVPLCWESPDVLRLGFDRVTARLGPLSAAAKRVIELLCAGVSGVNDPHAAVAEAIRMAGARDEGARNLAPVLPRYLSRHLPPALELGRVGMPALRTFIADNGRNVDGLARALDACGAFAFTRITSRPDMVLRVIRYLEPLEWTHRWLLSGTPHLLMRYTDTAIRIGPLVGGEGRPCHTCEALALVDVDPLLPRLAAQLVDTTPVSESQALTRIAIAHAVPFVHAWRQGEDWVHQRQLVLEVNGVGTCGEDDGDRERAPEQAVERARVSGMHWETVAAHPECGCAVAERQAA